MENKKRLRNPEKNNLSQKTKISIDWLQQPVESKNRFSNLSDEEIEKNDYMKTH